jgi:hypothetical protein
MVYPGTIHAPVTSCSCYLPMKVGATGTTSGLKSPGGKEKCRSRMAQVEILTPS